MQSPSNEGAFLVSATPTSVSHRGRGTGDGGAMLIGGRGSPNLGQSGLLQEHRRMVISGISGFDYS